MRLFLLLLASVSAFAQSSAPACDGEVAVVRVSAVKPGGTMEGLLAAVAAQKEWYKANGAPDEIFVARVIEGDRKTGARKYSETVALTYHIRPQTPVQLPNRGDAAWNAFSKLFQENSEIKNEYTTCMPKRGK